MYKITENLKLGALATFVPNKNLPVYNWLYYKEGFSRDLVFLLAEQFGLDKSSLVFDPFCGVATTQLACKQLGIPSFGFDAYPLAVFAAQVKLRDYDAEVLRENVKKLLKLKFHRPEIPKVPSVVQRSFSKYALEDIIFFRNAIKQVEDDYTREFLLLGLTSAAIRASWSIKDGSVIRTVKRNVPPLRVALKQQLFRMCKDLGNFKAENVKAEAEVGDARFLERVKQGSIDAVITSPPYLNKIEYTRVYALEEWIIFGREVSEPSLRSYVGLDTSTDDVFYGKYKMPMIAQAYFKDMSLVLQELARVCKEKAKIAIVVGNGCFPEFDPPVVNSDTLIAELAHRTDFDVKKILVLNKRWCTRQKTIKVGMSRESIVLLERS